MLISPTEAIRRFDVSKPTLYSDMKDGKLSFSLDGRKKRKIDVAELDRIYKKREEQGAKGNSENVNFETALTESYAVGSHGRLETLETEINFLKKELENRDSEVDRWQSAFDKAQTTADKITALLEDQRSNKEDSGAEWKKSLKVLEFRIANQEKDVRVVKEERQKILRQNQSLKKALSTEKNKTIWQRLFG